MATPEIPEDQGSAHRSGCADQPRVVARVHGRSGEVTGETGSAPFVFPVAGSKKSRPRLSHKKAGVRLPGSDAKGPKNMIAPRPLYPSYQPKTPPRGYRPGRTAA
jgi:hypothetical protein